MGIGSKSIFIILTAMVIASSILSVASLTFMNAVSGEFFRKEKLDAGADPVPMHRSDDVQRTRDKIVNYPFKMFCFYGSSFFLAVLLVIVYLGPLQVEDGVIAVRFISLEWGQPLHSLAGNVVFPMAVFFYLGYCCYVVWQTWTVCNNCFAMRSQSG